MSEEEFKRRLAETAISHDDAKEIALRLIAGSFNRKDLRPRFTIPTRHDDDDILIMEYIRRQKSERDRIVKMLEDDGDFIAADLVRRIDEPA